MPSRYPPAPGSNPPAPPPPGQPGPGWWKASDGRWYPPESAPGQAPPPPGQAWGTVYAPPVKNSLATASMALGVCSMVGFFTFGLGVILGLLAVVLGVLGMRRARELPGEPLLGRARAGVVMGILGSLIGGLFFVLIVAAIGDAVDDLPFDEINTDPPDGFCDEDRFWQDPDC